MWRERNARRAGLLAVCLALVWPGVVAAAGPPPPPGQSVDGFDTELGRRLLPLALARGGAETSFGKPGRFLRDVFDRLASSARRQRKLAYTLHILSAKDQLDAWALPDGSVFVTVGLLYRLQTVDEAAGVLAHQLAHAVLRHNLNRLDSPSGRAFLADLWAGKVPLTREGLGKHGLALLGEYYPTSEERAADSLARDLLRQNGYRVSGVEDSFRRVVGRTLPRYLQTHPHAGLKPLPGPSGPPATVIIIEEEPQEPPWLAPLPPPPPPRLAPPLPRPVLPPQVVKPPAGPAEQSGFAVLAGAYPVGAASSTTTLTFTDDFGPSSSTLTLTTSGVWGGATLGAVAEVPLGQEWEAVLGGGWVNADLFREKGRSNGGYVLGGALRRGSVDGQGVRWAVGPYLSYTWMAVPAGTITDPEGLVFGYDWVDANSSVTARATSLAAGALLVLSGDTPRPGLAWFAALAGQASLPGDWSFTAVTSQGREVQLPFTGQKPAPLSASGAVALGGLVFRF